jgi:hypothetical protein
MCLGLVRYVLFGSEWGVTEWLIIDFPVGSNLRTRTNPVVQV